MAPGSDPCPVMSVTGKTRHDKMMKMMKIIMIMMMMMLKVMVVFGYQVLLNHPNNETTYSFIVICK